MFKNFYALVEANRQRSHERHMAEIKVREEAEKNKLRMRPIFKKAPKQDPEPTCVARETRRYPWGSRGK